MKILVLGSSSWIGHYLIPELRNENCQVFGVSKSNNPAFEIENHLLQDLNFSSLEKIIDLINPDAIVNLLASKDHDSLVELQKQLVPHCAANNRYYFYASSANAIDGSGEGPHLEPYPPKASSEYGKMKQACEELMQDYYDRFSAIRFAATHGYSPQGDDRTETFLQKLKNGETVKVNTGIMQNRSYVGDLAKQMSAIILNRGTGVFHLGTVDEMDEFDFLQQLAVTFGYSKDKVAKDEPYPINVSVIPKKVFELYGDQHLLRQKDMFAKLKSSPELKKYIRS